ncbi:MULTISPECIES: hypothetical protein [Nonomuraea]|uniref:Uncharacterized protein n=1 Tax=Nonomuraea mangrovi TaxID=2316207 RepID=A0ABW4SR77_9ACTN
MSWIFIISLIAVLAIAGPFFGTDTRDSRDWRKLPFRRSGSPGRTA